MKILIADDEPLIRQRLREAIFWDKIDCKIIGEAQNGLEAVELIAELKPDIVITDIRMPGLDGLELIEKLKPDSLSIKFILLTGYSDFKYAQTAVKLGAFDFLLKPTDEDEILRVVEKAKNTLLEERKVSIADKARKLQEVKNIEAIKEMVLLNMISGNLQPESIDAEISDYFIGSEHRYCILNIEIDNLDWLEENIINDKIIDIKSNIVKYCSELNADYVEDRICINRQSSFILFLIFRSSTPVSKLNSYCLDIAKHLSEQIGSNYNFTVSIGISRVFSDITNINESCEESQKALELKFYKGLNSITSITEVPLQNSLPGTNYYGIYENIVSRVLSGNRNETKVEITSFFNILNNNKNISKMYVKTVVMQLLHLTIFSLKKSHPNVEDIIKDYEIEKVILGCNIISDIQTRTLAFFEQLIEFIYNDANVEKREYEGNTIIKEVLNYIKNNISTDISLNSAAQNVYVTPTYLCRLIKKKTGKNFTDIVLEYRIEKAKELLKNLQLKTYEIGDMVGFSYSRNFIIKFKQYVGMTPKEYRNSNM